MGRSTPKASRVAAEPLVGSWILLFPVTYLVHIAEEYWGGFPARTADLTGLEVPEAAFLGANAVFWVLMAGAAASAFRRPSRAPLVVALATIVAINAMLHVGGALLTTSYSAGLVSGVLLWLPLGVVTLARARRGLSERSFRIGVLTGVVAHVLVPVVGLGLVLIFGGGWRAA